MGDHVGSWGQRDMRLSQAPLSWASEQRVYEWKPSYTEGNAPYDPALEEELFSEENRVNSGINFGNYAHMKVFVKGGPTDLAPLKEFSDAALHPAVLENVVRMRYREPTPIQKNAMPIILAKYDIMACAQTGSGKTAAFLVPIISNLVDKIFRGRIKTIRRRSGVYSSKPSPLFMVILPTRELAIQIFEEARRFTYRTPLRPVVIYGGSNTQVQREQLAKGVDILVATPGRLKDMIERGNISLQHVRHVVLDEADRMLDMGFEPQVREIMMASDMTRDESLQTLMFSATFPTEIQALARDFLKDNCCRLRIGRIGGTTTDIVQKIVWVEEFEKRDMLFPTCSIHGDRTQLERELSLKAFKEGKSPILIATAVASRGLDIKDVMHVINYDLDNDIDEYVHRIGRTARAGNCGYATTFFTGANESLAPQLTKLLLECQQEIPEFLQSYIDPNVSYETEEFVEDESTAEDPLGGWGIGGGQ